MYNFEPFEIEMNDDDLWDLDMTDAELDDLFDSESFDDVYE
ncbi:hypothetical protein [Photobacterium minamisatsumaniensis]